MPHVSLIIHRLGTTKPSFILTITTTKVVDLEKCPNLEGFSVTLKTCNTNKRNSYNVPHKLPHLDTNTLIIFTYYLLHHIHVLTHTLSLDWKWSFLFRYSQTSQYIAPLEGASSSYIPCPKLLPTSITSSSGFAGIRTLFT